MERRELYDPEDIEQLLLERPFDELLDEERAFVLRHLTGRDEYERMRNLLLTVHETEREVEVLEAEPVVRDRVLEAFRMQRQPQWRIWLNSVGGFFLPQERRGYWKPALAFASIAVLVTVSVIGFQRSNATSEQLAEVKQAEEVKKEDFKVTTGENQPEQPAAAVPANELQTEQLNATPAEPERTRTYTWITPEGSAEEVAADLQEKDDLSGLKDGRAANGFVAPGAVALPPAASGSYSLITREDEATGVDDEKAADYSAFRLKKNEDAELAGSIGYLDTVRLQSTMDVTSKNLAENYNIANESPTSVMKVEAAAHKAKLAKQRSRALVFGQAGEVTSAVDADLMGLLRAAW